MVDGTLLDSMGVSRDGACVCGVVYSCRVDMQC